MNLLVYEYVYIYGLIGHIWKKMKYYFPLTTELVLSSPIKKCKGQEHVRNHGIKMAPPTPKNFTFNLSELELFMNILSNLKLEDKTSDNIQYHWIS